MIQWRKVNRKVKWDTERPKPVAIVHHAGNRIELFEENQTERF
jgi:hypothetical protein